MSEVDAALSPPICEKIANKKPFRSAAKGKKRKTPAKAKTPSKSKTPSKTPKKSPGMAATVETPIAESPNNTQTPASAVPTLADIGGSPDSCASYETMDASFEIEKLVKVTKKPVAKKVVINKKRSPKKATSTAPASATAAAKKPIINLKVNRRLTLNSNAVTKSATTTTATSTGSKKESNKSKSPRKSTLLTATASTCVKQRTKSTSDLLGASISSATASSTLAANSTKSLTVPVTPKLTKKQYRETVAPKPLSSEEMELKRIEQEKKLLADQLHKNRRLYHKVRSTAGQAKPVVASTKALTVPKTPTMHAMKKASAVSKSARKRSSPNKRSPKKESHLQKQDAVGAAVVTGYTGPKAPTIPEPFKFAQSSRRTSSGAERGGSAASGPAALSSAELAEKFCSGTRSFPSTSVSSSKKQQQQGPTIGPDGQYIAKPLTIAESPKFSKVRDAPKVASTAELEEQQMQQIKPFKARVMDRRIFESMGELGVPKVSARGVTEPKEFHWASGRGSLTSAAEHGQWHDPSSTAAAAHNSPPASSFKARPMPVFQPADPCGATPAQTKPLTEARSPKMNGAHRASSAPARRQKPHHSVVEQERLAAAEEYKKRRQSSIVANGSSGHQGAPLTEPKEFSFQTSVRGEQHKIMMEQRIQQEAAAAAAAREVRARPLPPPPTPSNANTNMPPATPKQPTVAKPFNLRSTVKHEDVLSQKQLQLQQEEEKARESAKFHARPVPKSTYQAHAEPVLVRTKSFKDTTSTMPPPPSTPVVLNSDIRAAKRASFDAQVSTQMKLAAEEKQRRLLQEMQKENQEITSLRRKSVEEGGMLFKAHPVQTKDTYKSGFVEAKPLTEPKSPYLRTKQRAGTQAAFGGGGYTADHNQALFTQALNNV